MGVVSEVGVVWCSLIAVLFCCAPPLGVEIFSQSYSTSCSNLLAAVPHLKRHYPVEKFLASLLTAENSRVAGVQIYIWPP